MDAADDLTLQKIRGKASSVKKTIAGIMVALECDLETILRFTICKDNQHQLIACYKMARHLGANRFQIKPLVSCGRAVNSAAFLTANQISQRLAELAVHATEDVTQPEVLCWPPEMSAGLPSKGCGSLDKIYVSSHLEVSICNYVSETKPLGNLGKNSLESVLLQRSGHTWKSPRDHKLIVDCPQRVFFEDSTSRGAYHSPYLVRGIK